SPRRATLAPVGTRSSWSSDRSASRLRFDHPRADGLATEELDRELVHRVRDVGGGHHLAVGRDQDAGAGLVERRDAPGGGNTAALMSPATQSAMLIAPAVRT